jgi:TetR/AcrR family transcriptional regulator
VEDPGRTSGRAPDRAERKALQRGRILEAAREVFFRDGFMAANLDEVAQIAGVAKGTLYRYFENKADLYVAVLAANGQVFEERMRAAASGPGSPAEQIRELGRFYFGHWTRNREYFQIFWALENEGLIGDLPKAVVEQVTKLWENCLQILADVIGRGVARGDFAPCDAWEVANILWTVANGLIQTEHVAPRRELRGREVQEVFDDMVELFLRGLRRMPPS